MPGVVYAVASVIRTSETPRSNLFVVVVVVVGVCRPTMHVENHVIRRIRAEVDTTEVHVERRDPLLCGEASRVTRRLFPLIRRIIDQKPTNPHELHIGQNLRGLGPIHKCRYVLLFVSPAARRQPSSARASVVMAALDCSSVSSSTRQNSLPKGSCITAQSITGASSPCDPGRG